MQRLAEFKESVFLRSLILNCRVINLCFGVAFMKRLFLLLCFFAAFLPVFREQFHR